MRLRVRSIASARAAIASMAFVATASATTNVWHAAPRKKEAARTAFVVRLLMTRIPTTIAPLARVTGKTCARTTTGFLARQQLSVCQITASMDSAVETFAWARVKRARQRKKAAEAMGFAETSRRDRILIVNAQAAGRVTALGPVPRA